MKKFFVITFLFLQSFNLFAQVDINEFDLVGKWKLESYTGEFNYKSRYAHPDTIDIYTEEKLGYGIGKLSVVALDQPKGYISTEIREFFITYGSTRIIHLFETRMSTPILLRFRIIKYNGEELELATFDGKGTLLYKRESVTNNIRNQSVNKEYTGDVYSINGTKIGDNASKGIVIKDGKKIIAK